MKIATWNVNGVRARQAQVQEFIEREQPDVLCLQELKAARDQLPVWLADLDGYWCYWHGDKGYSGVGLLVRKATYPVRPMFGHPAFDVEHRIVTTRLPEATVASVYVPNGGKDFAAKMGFLAAMDGYAAELHATGHALILCGDLNVTRTDSDVHPKERRADAIGQRPSERALIERVLSRDLVDVHRLLDPENSDLFTWWAPWRKMKERNIGWRIDYILASSSIAGQVTSCSVRREFGTSDHGPVVAEFRTPSHRPILDARPRLGEDLPHG
jgi:exodeoxyribonuclease-3